MPKNRIDIDTLNHRLNGGIRTHVVLLSEAYRIAQEALNKGLVFDYKKDDTPLLSDYIHQFWSFDESPYVRSKQAEGGSITKIQCYKLAHVFDKHVKDNLRPNMRLDELRVADVERIKQKMFEKGLSSSSICKMLESLRTPLNYAYKMEIISNPIGAKLKNVKRTDGERGILSADETKAVISKLRDSYPVDSYERLGYLFIATMLNSGMRNSEVATIKADDLEIKNEETTIIHVRHSFNRLDGVKSPKNGKTRLTTIPTSLAEQLLAYDKLFSASPYIFFSALHPDQPVDDGAVRDLFYSALENIGIDEKERTRRGIVVYSCRHFFNSKMLTTDLSETELRAVIGHSSARMTMNYNHQTSESLEREATARSKVIPAC